MLKIGLEATRANRQYKTGTEWYAWHLLQEFKKLDRQNNFFVYYNKFLSDDLLKGAPDNFYFKSLPWPFRKFWTHIRLSWYLLWHGLDKFFATNAVPLITRGEVIVTIHDLGFFRYPHLYHPLERVYQKWSHRLAIRRAKKIITISEATKRDIIKYFPKTANKIRVIHLGWNEHEFGPLSPAQQDDFIGQHELPDNFLLYIGRLETKKNIQNLIKAYKQTSRKWPLVLAGRPGNFGYEEIQALAKDPEIKDDIILMGYVSQKNYPKLMACASAFVFPSKFEGFGIPLLEAMACHVPIACSDMPVLHEVASDAAIFFNPDDTGDIKEKIESLMTDENLREKLINNGAVRAKNFSWAKCARETLKYILE